MTVVLQHLDSLIGPIKIEQLYHNKKYWRFGKELNSKNNEYVHPAVRNHSVLHLEYNAQSSRLARHFVRNSVTVFNEEEKLALTEQLVAALAMAELLAHIYQYYLSVPREVVRLQKEQKIYRHLLRMRGYHFGRERTSGHLDYSLSLKVRQNTANANWTRLFIVRGRRVFTTLAPVIAHFPAYKHFITFVDIFAAPVLNYLSWLFFVPRLATNSFLLAKHLIPGSWMSKQEKSMPISLRLRAQLDRRWFEMGNDIVWATTGILGCFVLLGPLAPIGVYLTLASFVYDVLLSSIRAYVEISRLWEVQAYYDSLAGDANPQQLVDIKDYQQSLNAQIAIEYKRHAIRLTTTIFLCLAMITVLPLFAFNPAIAFGGAIAIIVISLIVYSLGRWLESSLPPNKVADLANITEESLVIDSTTPLSDAAELPLGTKLSEPMEIDSPKPPVQQVEKVSLGSSPHSLFGHSSPSKRSVSSSDEYKFNPKGMN